MARTSTRQDPRNRGSGSPARESTKAASALDAGIPVLIRLPDLTDNADEAPPASAAARHEPPSAPARSQQPVLDLRAAGIPVTREMDEAEAAAPRSGGRSAADVTPPRMAIAYAAAGFRRLRLAGQITVAVLLVGLFIAAYLTIIGGRGELKKTPPPEVSAAEQTDGVPNEPAPEPKKPSDIAKPSKGLLPPKLAVGNNAAKSTADATDGAAASAREPPPPPPPSRPETPPPEPEKKTAPRSAGSGDTIRRPDPPADSRPKADKLWQGLDTFEKPPAASPPPAGNSNQLELSPPAAAPPRNSTAQTSHGRYPLTDPARFRYPERYHEVLDAASAERSPEGLSRRSGSSESGANTARLPPRMAPPPIR